MSCASFARVLTGMIFNNILNELFWSEPVGNVRPNLEQFRKIGTECSISALRSVLLYFGKWI